MYLSDRITAFSSLRLLSEPMSRTNRSAIQQLQHSNITDVLKGITWVSSGPYRARPTCQQSLPSLASLVVLELPEVRRPRPNR